MAMGTVKMDHGRPGVGEISGARHKDISGGYYGAPFFLFLLTARRPYVVCGVVDLLLFRSAGIAPYRIVSSGP